MCSKLQGVRPADWSTILHPDRRQHLSSTSRSRASGYGGGITECRLEKASHTDRLGGESCGAAACRVLLPAYDRLDLFELSRAWALVPHCERDDRPTTLIWSELFSPPRASMICANQSLGARPSTRCLLHNIAHGAGGDAYRPRAAERGERYLRPAVPNPLRL